MKGSLGFLALTALLLEPPTHEWHWKKKLPERKGEKCRVLVRGKNNSILVRFEDGELVVTSRYAVRKLK